MTLNRARAAVCLLGLFFALTGCGGDKPAEPAVQAPPLAGESDRTHQPKAEETAGGTKPATAAVPDGDQDTHRSAGELYRLAFEAMFSMDEALNSEMKYIALDLSDLPQLTDADREHLLSSFAFGDVDVRDATMEELKKEEPEFKETMVLQGILLKIKKVELGENSAVIEGSKYRSGKGAIGAKITLELKEGAWSVTESEMTWIS
ncbi:MULTISPECIES: hypothetical protein [Paenibacillus]|uniref:hypothetical protein n=1 Tax=Paenibacillus TaxID=44249 RepID=UPI002FDFB2CC